MRSRYALMAVAMSLLLPLSSDAAKHHKRSSTTSPSVGVVQGNVYRNGNVPVRKAFVRLRNASVTHHHGSHIAHRAHTSAAGGFTIKAPPGGYTIIASKRHVGKAQSFVRLAAGQTVSNIKLFLGRSRLRVPLHHHIHVPVATPAPAKPQPQNGPQHPVAPSTPQRIAPGTPQRIHG